MERFPTDPVVQKGKNFIWAFYDFCSFKFISAHFLFLPYCTVFVSPLGEWSPPLCVDRGPRSSTPMWVASFFCLDEVGFVYFDLGNHWACRLRFYRPSKIRDQISLSFLHTSDECLPPCRIFFGFGSRAWTNRPGEVGYERRTSWWSWTDPVFSEALGDSSFTMRRDIFIKMLGPMCPWVVVLIRVVICHSRCLPWLDGPPTLTYTVYFPGPRGFIFILLLVLDYIRQQILLSSLCVNPG